MKIFNNINIPKNYKNSALAIGNFDGVHKGHQKVFKETKKFAKRKKIKFGVLTFTPLPIMFFYKNIKNFRLTSEDQKSELFKKHQVDFVINIKFNKNFLQIIVIFCIFVSLSFSFYQKIFYNIETRNFKEILPFKESIFMFTIIFTKKNSIFWSE